MCMKSDHIHLLKHDKPVELQGCMPYGLVSTSNIHTVTEAVVSIIICH